MKGELYELELFAGAGGGILGGMLCGHTCIGACEIEKYPRDVLLARQRDGLLPKFPIWDDIRTFRSDNSECSDYFDFLRIIKDKLVIKGGFPCQDLSTSGSGEGLDGARSGLWFEFLRIIREIRPKGAWVENSPELVRNGLVTIASGLAEMGYDFRWCVLGSDDIGACHHRKRFWGMATNSEIVQCNVCTTQHGWSTVGKKISKSRNSNSPIIADSKRIGQQESRTCKYGGGEAQKGDRKANITFHDCAGGIWSISKPVLCRGDDGLVNSVDRLKAVGNGQDPRVVKLAWDILTDGL